MEFVQYLINMTNEIKTLIDAMINLALSIGSLLAVIQLIKNSLK